MRGGSDDVWRHGGGGAHVEVEARHVGEARGGRRNAWKISNGGRRADK